MLRPAPDEYTEFLIARNRAGEAADRLAEIYDLLPGHAPEFLARVQRALPGDPLAGLDRFHLPSATRTATLLRLRGATPETTPP